MVDYDRLMKIFSTPRPNGSAGERKTRKDIKEWLNAEKIPHSSHRFRSYPYFFELIGIWLIISRTLLAFAVWQRWGWPALILALIGMIGGTLDVAFHLPLISWPGFRQAENIVLEFGPLDAEQEIIFSAHYDTKTEVLDHQQRMFFLKNLKGGLIITFLLGIISPLEATLLSAGSSLSQPMYVLGLILTVPMLFLAWGLGMNFILGRMIQPSPGAVDNGTACAVLLGLAHSIFHSEHELENTRLTIALFTGEEVNLQGSRAYAASRAWPQNTVAVNLEVMAQDGPYVVWDLDGGVFRLVPTDDKVNEALRDAVRTVTGQTPVSGGPIISDGASFIAAGIQTGVLGTYDTQFIDTGFHRPTDNLDRVVFERIPEAVKILGEFLTGSNAH